MARVKATQTRIICQYRDAAGHRLPSEKGVWYADRLDDIMADCPKCPEPEPVECGSAWHRMSLDNLRAHGVKFCDRCGKRLRED